MTYFNLLPRYFSMSKSTLDLGLGFQGQILAAEFYNKYQKGQLTLGDNIKKQPVNTSKIKFI